MITSSDDRNFIIVLTNIFLFLSIIFTAIYNQRLAILIPVLNVYADVNLFLLVAILFADKFESVAIALIHTVIYGIMFDIYYTNSVGLFTLYVSFSVIVAMVTMRNSSNSLIIRTMIIVLLLVFKDLYLYFVYSTLEASYISFKVVLYRMLISVPYNIFIYVVLFNIFSLIRRYRDITYSNM